MALITGASRGIGRGIALELAAAGWDLLINYRSNRHAAEQTARDCRQAAPASAANPARMETFAADIATREARRDLVDFARTAFGRLDLLVNNAGMAPRRRADLLEATEQSFDEVLSTNLKGPYFLTQQIARWMIDQVRAAPPTALAPKIVNVSSVSTYAASVNRGDYCVSKAGLSMMTRLYALRLAEFGIAVYEVRPGIVETDMTAPVRGKYESLIRKGLTPIRRWGTPEDVGKAVLAIAGGAFPFSTGEVINVDGGFHLRAL